jgi:hypothetical protein
VLCAIAAFSSFELKYESKQMIFEGYLNLLLIDNRLSDFHRIAETEKIFKSCHHLIQNKQINCSKVDKGITGPPRFTDNTKSVGMHILGPTHNSNVGIHI